jgi:hypothetical protein
VAHEGTTINWYVNPPAKLTVPFEPVTTTSTAPTDPGGVTAVTVVEFTTTRFVTGTPPIVTAVVPDRYCPEIVMEVPPE